MNIQVPAARPLLGLDAALVDAARRIQLSPTKHAKATSNFEALCGYVDRPDSPLHGKVIGCFGSGSFGTGTAIAISVSRNQHDVDAVVELNVRHDNDPEDILSLLYEAINGEKGSRYHGKVRRNSRCITVAYEDGVTVDLMPVARLGIQPERASNAFHWNYEQNEKYHKPVDPYDFREYFNKQVSEDRLFVEAFQRQAVLAQDSEFVLKADTEPLPAAVPIEQKSPLVVAIQLLKRYRDIRHRARPGLRKPPSVMLNALALDFVLPTSSFVEVVLGLAAHIRGKLVTAQRAKEKIVVKNPAWQFDIFTDRWPESLDAQQAFILDLDNFINTLTELHRFPTQENIQRQFKHLFGETVADYATSKHYEALAKEAASGKLSVGAKGVVLGSATATATVKSITPVRANTNFGGGALPE